MLPTVRNAGRDARHWAAMVICSARNRCEKHYPD